MGLLDFEEGAVQREVPGHCFSNYDQELFTRKVVPVVPQPNGLNRGEALNSSREKGAQRLCVPLTGLFSKGRKLESDIKGPY